MDRCGHAGYVRCAEEFDGHPALSGAKRMIEIHVYFHMYGMRMIEIMYYG